MDAAIDGRVRSSCVFSATSSDGRVSGLVASGARLGPFRSTLNTPEGSSFFWCRSVDLPMWGHDPFSPQALPAHPPDLPSCPKIEHRSGEFDLSGGPIDSCGRINSPRRPSPGCAASQRFSHRIKPAYQPSSTALHDGVTSRRLPMSSGMGVRTMRVLSLGWIGAVLLHVAGGQRLSATATSAVVCATDRVQLQLLRPRGDVVVAKRRTGDSRSGERSHGQPRKRFGRRR